MKATRRKPKAEKFEGGNPKFESSRSGDPQNQIRNTRESREGTDGGASVANDPILEFRILTFEFPAAGMTRLFVVKLR
jgi:hypothetical protein